MIVTDKFDEVLAREGVVAIVDRSRTHAVNTWNSYLRKSGEDNLLIPAL